MDIQHITDSMGARGVGPTFRDLIYRAANKVTDVRVLSGMALTMDSLDPSYLQELAGMSWGFLGQERLEASFGQGIEQAMTHEFIHDAITKGDRCYGACDGDRVVAYGWYSTRPTAVTDGLLLRFAEGWAYMYKGYTLPEYRGRRLHGLAMARALRAYAEEGKDGLVSYVDVTNEASLKSCRRMGYRELGLLVGALVGGRWVTHASKACQPYGLALERVAMPTEALSFVGSVEG
jgi:hypothetical protein